MRFHRALALAVVLFMSISSLVAQVNGDAVLQVREDDGGSVIVRGPNGLLNQSSSLKRKWYAIDDAACTVRLNRTGIYTKFDNTQGTYAFVPVGSLTPKQAISAVEVRYILFDVWGQRIRTLSLTKLADSATSVDFRDSSAWPAWEPEVSNLVTVVAFVARVRTADGAVWTYDKAAMLQQIQTLGVAIAQPDMVPDDQQAVQTRAIVYWGGAGAPKKPATP